MLATSPPGSPQLESMHRIDSGLFDALQSNPSPTDDPCPPPTPMPLSGMKDSKDSASDHPIDIFGTSPGTSAHTNNTRIAPKSTTNKTHVAMDCPPPQQTIAQDESLREKLDSLGILSRRCRRVALRTDHPLECDTPLKIKDAEDLDLENKIRSALRERKLITRFDATNHKTVRFDPAIILLGSEKGIVKRESVITKPFDHPESKAQIDDIGTNEERLPKLKDSLQTILSLKRHERLQLRELLDNLSKIEDSPPTIHSAAKVGKRLNPRALEFCESFKPHTHLEKLNNGHNGLFTLPVRPSLRRQSLPPIWVRTSKIINPLTEPIVAITPVIRNANPIRTPVPTVPPPPMVDDGHGREAKVVAPDWAKSILDKFTVKYPLTGKLKAAAPGDSKGRLAAAIQQRLEYLLMEKREKEGLETPVHRENTGQKENIIPAQCESLGH